MARRATQSQAEHDQVVLAAQSKLQSRFGSDRRVTANPGTLQNLEIGSDRQPHYPDVLVWKPCSSSFRQGTAEIILEVETRDSLTEDEAMQWKAYGKLPVLFYLVIPEGEEDRVRGLLHACSARVSQLWTYKLAGEQVSLEEEPELAVAA